MQQHILSIKKNPFFGNDLITFNSIYNKRKKILSNMQRLWKWKSNIDYIHVIYQIIATYFNVIAWKTAETLTKDEYIEDLSKYTISKTSWNSMQLWKRINWSFHSYYFHHKWIRKHKGVPLSKYCHAKWSPASQKIVFKYHLIKFSNDIMIKH